MDSLFCDSSKSNQPGLIPPDNQHAVGIFDARGFEFVIIAPSIHDGFFYITTAPRDDFGEFHLEGSRRPIRSDRVEKYLKQKLRGDYTTTLTTCAEAAVMASAYAGGPWDFNRALYNSKQQSTDCMVGKAAL
jgi:hypothetical protein